MLWWETKCHREYSEQKTDINDSITYSHFWIHIDLLFNSNQFNIKYSTVHEIINEIFMQADLILNSNLTIFPFGFEFEPDGVWWWIQFLPILTRTFSMQQCLDFYHFSFPFVFHGIQSQCESKSKIDFLKKSNDNNECKSFEFGCMGNAFGCEIANQILIFFKQLLAFVIYSCSNNKKQTHRKYISVWVWIGFEFGFEFVCCCCGLYAVSFFDVNFETKCGFLFIQESKKTLYTNRLNYYRRIGLRILLRKGKKKWKENVCVCVCSVWLR